jgi:hypothetical protein
MNRTLLGRIIKVEVARAAPRSRIAVLPHDACDHGPEHCAAAKAEVAREYQTRTGHLPTVLIVTGVPR